MSTIHAPISTQSIWAESVAQPIYPSLDESLLVDVAIVGAGITGLTAATLLAEAGKSVAILEARRIGSGDSGNTTAHLATVLDLRFSKLIDNFGESKAKLVVDWQNRSMAQIGGLASRYGIECELEPLSGFLFSESEDDRAELEKELEASLRCGAVAHWMDHNPLPFEIAAGLRFEGQGRFHVLKYLYGLADVVEARGGRIFEETRVVEYEDGEPCRLVTPGGVVQAKNVVLATHSPIGLLLSMQPRLAAYRSYAVAARLTRRAPDHLFWDMSKPYHYLRRFNGIDRSILIAGGADHKTGEKDSTEECYAEMETYVRRRFDVQSIEFCWSAQTFESPDGLPYIGRLPMSGHLYAGTGYSGNGMTFGTAAGALIADEIMGRADPESLELFSPGRIKLVASAGNFLRENLDSAKRLIVDAFSKGDIQGLEDIPPGGGRIAEVGGVKLAVHRAPSGELIGLSPICTHAGCTVAWNEAEKSWDCPCHGSRFSAMGEVIEAPATKPLERREIRE